MEVTRLANISAGILSLLCRKRSVDEQLVHIYMDGLTDSFEEPNTVLPDSYMELNEKLNDIWTYRQFENMTVEDVFLLGSIYGATTLKNTIQQRKKKQKDIAEMAKIYKPYEWFFKAILDNPGHKYENINIDDKILNDLIKNQIVVLNHIGKEKHFYLTNLGEQIYYKMKGGN